MIVFASWQNLMSLTPNKSMPKKSNDDFMEKYSKVLVVSLEPTSRPKTAAFFAVRHRFRIRVKHMMT